MTDVYAIIKNEESHEDNFEINCPFPISTLHMLQVNTNFSNFFTNPISIPATALNKLHSLFCFRTELANHFRDQIRSYKGFGSNLNFTIDASPENVALLFSLPGVTQMINSSDWEGRKRRKRCLVADIKSQRINTHSKYMTSITASVSNILSLTPFLGDSFYVFPCVGLHQIHGGWINMKFGKLPHLCSRLLLTFDINSNKLHVKSCVDQAVLNDENSNEIFYLSEDGAMNTSIII
jgi:hypothetical protein